MFEIRTAQFDTRILYNVNWDDDIPTDDDIAIVLYFFNGNEYLYYGMADWVRRSFFCLKGLTLVWRRLLIIYGLIDDGVVYLYQMDSERMSPVTNPRATTFRSNGRISLESHSLKHGHFREIVEKMLCLLKYRE